MPGDFKFEKLNRENPEEGQTLEEKESEKSYEEKLLDLIYEEETEWFETLKKIKNNEIKKPLDDPDFNITKMDKINHPLERQEIKEKKIAFCQEQIDRYKEYELRTKQGEGLEVIKAMIKDEPLLYRLNTFLSQFSFDPYSYAAQSEIGKHMDRLREIKRGLKKERKEKAGEKE